MASAGEGHVWQGPIRKASEGHREILGVMDIFIILIMVMVSGVYTQVKIY